MPRRRRGARAIELDTEIERNLVMRILLSSPKDLAGCVLAFAVVTAIVANALFLQAGHHPSPMFRSTIAPLGLATVSPLPRSRPAELALKSSDALAPGAKAVEPASTDPLANLVKATSAPAATASIPRPPAPVPVSTRNETGPTSAQGSRRVAAVQRTLTEYGYGQLKPTGTIGADTVAAIQKFERARRIPVTGQISDRLVHELVAMIGHPID